MLIMREQEEAKGMEVQEEEMLPFLLIDTSKILSLCLSILVELALFLRGGVLVLLVLGHKVVHV